MTRGDILGGIARLVLEYYTLVKLASAHCLLQGTNSMYLELSHDYLALATSNCILFYIQRPYTQPKKPVQVAKMKIECAELILMEGYTISMLPTGILTG